MTRRTLIERELLINWNDAEPTAIVSTTSPLEKRHLESLGYRLVVDGHYSDGAESSWSATVPKRAIRFRRLVDGQIRHRDGHRKGQLFAAARSIDRAEAAESSGPMVEAGLEEDRPDARDQIDDPAPSISIETPSLDPPAPIEGAPQKHESPAGRPGISPKELNVEPIPTRRSG